MNHLPHDSRWSQYVETPIRETGYEHRPARAALSPLRLTLFVGRRRAKAWMVSVRNWMI